MMLKTRPEVVWGESTEIESRKSKGATHGSEGYGRRKSVYSIHD